MRNIEILQQGSHQEYRIALYTCDISIYMGIIDILSNFDWYSRKDNVKIRYGI